LATYTAPFDTVLALRLWRYERWRLLRTAAPTNGLRGSGLRHVRNQPRTLTLSQGNTSFFMIAPALCSKSIWRKCAAERLPRWPLAPLASSAPRERPWLRTRFEGQGGRTCSAWLVSCRGPMSGASAAVSSFCARQKQCLLNCLRTAPGTRQIPHVWLAPMSTCADLRAGVPLGSCSSGNRASCRLSVCTVVAHHVPSRGTATPNS